MLVTGFGRGLPIRGDTSLIPEMNGRRVSCILRPAVLLFSPRLIPDQKAAKEQFKAVGALLREVPATREEGEPRQAVAGLACVFAGR